MRLTRAALGALAAFALLGACGVEVPDDVAARASTTATTAPAGGTTTAPPMSDDELEQALIDNGYTSEEAACGAERLRAELDEDEIRDIVEADSVDDIPPDIAERFAEALGACLEGGGDDPGPRAPTTPGR